MAGDTKKRILDVALKEFSEKGYEATNIREIAEQLGIAKSAIYKHYKSKEDIWNALTAQIDIHYDEHFGSLDNLPPVPKSAEELVQLVLHMTAFTINDPHIKMIRRMLTIEQFRDENMKNQATKHFLVGLKKMFTEIFDQMVDEGVMKHDDTEILAFELTAPITQLVHLCDRQPEQIGEVMKQIEKYTRHFVKIYCR